MVRLESETELWTGGVPLGRLWGEATRGTLHQIIICNQGPSDNAHITIIGGSSGVHLCFMENGIWVAA